MQICSGTNNGEDNFEELLTLVLNAHQVFAEHHADGDTSVAWVGALFDTVAHCRQNSKVWCVCYSIIHSVARVLDGEVFIVVC